jgi:hypothetical protein
MPVRMERHPLRLSAVEYPAENWVSGMYQALVF